MSERRSCAGSDSAFSRKRPQNPLPISTKIRLQTHSVTLANSVAHFVVSLGLDGRIASQNPIDEALKRDPILLAEIAKDNVLDQTHNSSMKPEDQALPETKIGKLVMLEEVAEGHVSWSARMLMFTPPTTPMS